jgi:hypothetical protein
MQENKANEKGSNFEYLISSLFQSHGYLTRRAIPLQYGSSNQDATDIDVLGIYFTIPFKSHLIICDCKNKSKSNPHERVFWVKGLGQFINASEVSVALPKCSWDFIKFANKGGVRVITSDVFETYSTSVYKFGLADETFYNNFLEKISPIVKTDKQADEALIIARKLFLKDDPYVAFNTALNILKDIIAKKLTLTDSLSQDDYYFWKYICCEYTIITGLQLLNICVDVVGLPKQAREIHIKEKLTYGDLEPTKVRSILSSAENLANEIVKTTIPKSMLPNSKIIDFGKIPPPAYANDVIGLVERAFLNPDWYITMPQLLDYLLFEQGLKGNDFSDQPYRDIYKYSYPDEKLKAARNIMAFVRDKAGINWKHLWPKSEGHLPKISEENNV